MKQLVARIKRLPDEVLLASILILGTFLRFLNIAKSSIWHDEGFTMMLAPQSPAQIVARTARDVHPPLYYITLHYWMLVFGRSETAARGLSAVFMLLTVIVGFFLVRRLFDRKAALLAALFLAVGPFLIRYSQEARMYAMVAFLVTLATFCLLRAISSNAWRDWTLYAIVIAAALYTHYYSVFVIAAHWFYVAVVTLRPAKKGQRAGLKNPRWWGANILAAGLFAPWLPAAYHQFTRVQASFWIPPVNLATLPGTIGQFLTFTDLGRLPLIGRLVGFTLLILVILAGFWQNRRQLNSWVLITVFTVFGPLAVFVLSFKRPIYVDRYFVFSAVGFYSLLAVCLYFVKPWRNRPNWRRVSVVILLLVFSIGIRDVYAQSNHQMRLTAAYVNSRFQPGDVVVAGEIYVYFDFSYYNQTGQTMKLLAPDGVTGYGESSLLYDRGDQIVARNYADLHPASGIVWVVGKTGQHDYFDKVPANWQKIGPEFMAGYTAAQRYRVD